MTHLLAGLKLCFEVLGCGIELLQHACLLCHPVIDTKAAPSFILVKVLFRHSGSHLTLIDLVTSISLLICCWHGCAAAIPDYRVSMQWDVVTDLPSNLRM